VSVTGNAVVAIPRGEQILVQRLLATQLNIPHRDSARSEGPDTDAKDNMTPVPLGMYGHTEIAMALMDRGGRY
jgi:hypothetical protein